MVRRWSQVGFCTTLVQQLQQYGDAEILDACQAALESTACRQAQQILLQGGRPFQPDHVASACSALVGSWSARQTSFDDTEKHLLARRGFELQQFTAQRGKRAASAREELDWAIWTKKSRYETAPREPLPPYNVSKDEKGNIVTDAMNTENEDYVQGQTFTPRTTTTTTTTTTKTTRSRKAASASKGANHTNATNSTNVTAAAKKSSNTTTAAPGQTTRLR